MGITAVLLSPDLAVDAGESVATGVRLRNDGAEDVRVRLAVTGPAGPFSWVAPDTVPVPAGGEAAVRLGFHMPKSSVPAAGALPFELTAGGASVAGGVVRLRPFSRLSATLTAEGEDRHRLTLGNRGNAPTPTALRAEAEGDPLDVRIEPASVVVVPGGTAHAVVTVGGVGASRFRIVAEPEFGPPVHVGGAFPESGAGGADAAVARAGGAERPGRPAAGRRRAGLAAAAIAAAVALLAAIAVFAAGGEDGATSADGDDDAVGFGVGPPLAACPAQGHTDTYGVRGLAANEIANLPKDFTFLRVKADGCQPMRFNPCEPVHYIQNSTAAPPFAVENVREAFRRLAAATGMTFVDDGFTDETTRAGPHVPERYPGRWAPILILWDHFPPEQTTGRSQVFGNTNVMREGDVTVSGRLRFNVDAYRDELSREPIQAGFGPPAGSGEGAIGRNNLQWGRIILHELAHVMGLGHSSDFGSLMYPDAVMQTARPADFQRPDLEGLRYLGRDAGCLASPRLPET